jgi:predicted nucleotidyltransferase
VPVDNDDFVRAITDGLASLRGVQAIALGGSRAQGTERPDSDWDFAIYYRGVFDPQTLRDIGWVGEVSDIGAWGGGVFNGGAWLEVEERRLDVHYRDLNAIDQEIAAATDGSFRIEPLLFHLAGIPSYLVIAELAICRVMYGELPRPVYPTQLRARAPHVWWNRALQLFDYAQGNYASRGQLAQCVAMVTQAAVCAGHAVLAARGQWVTNEKRLLSMADLEDLDSMVTDALSSVESLEALVNHARNLCRARVEEARSD